jgi:hypothetical protein
MATAKGAALTEMWLIRKRGYVPPGDTSTPKAVAHIWTGEDTVCRMHSTGGLGRGRPRYEVATDRGAHRICDLCQQVATGMTEAERMWEDATVQRERYWKGL